MTRHQGRFVGNGRNQIDFTTLYDGTSTALPKAKAASVSFLFVGVATVAYVEWQLMTAWLLLTGAQLYFTLCPLVINWGLVEHGRGCAYHSLGGGASVTVAATNGGKPQGA